MGRSDDRLLVSTPILAVIADSECHWALAYPERPRLVREGAIIYISRQTREPNDHRIIGRAVGMQHVPGRDEATPEDCNRRPWKRHWRYYIRVRQPEFLSGTLENGISLNKLMDALGADSFATTQENARTGKGNINPRMSIRQQPAVRLSSDGHAWLDTQIQAAFNSHGATPNTELDNLGWPDLS